MKVGEKINPGSSLSPFFLLTLYVLTPRNFSPVFFLFAELVLDFDPLRSADLTSDMKEMVEHVWRDRPVVMLGKGHGDPYISLPSFVLLRGLEVLMTSSALRHCRKTRDLRNTLLGMRIVPEPSIFFIDVRRACLFLLLNLPSTARPY